MGCYHTPMAPPKRIVRRLHDVGGVAGGTERRSETGGHSESRDDRVVVPKPPSYHYDATKEPLAVVVAGTTVHVKTLDARSGRFGALPVGTVFHLPAPEPANANPLTGPIAVIGAPAGDALIVDVIRVEPTGNGWIGAYSLSNPLGLERIDESLGRICKVSEESVYFSRDVVLDINPMIGCLGTAVVGAPPRSNVPGRHGGNMDQPTLTAGSRVYLPTQAEGGLLYVGDVHALQGDGELSGTGVEIAADVTLRVAFQRGLTLHWPWIETVDRLAVVTAAHEFVDARREAVDAMVAALVTALHLRPAEALQLLSVAGRLRIGQAYGGDLELTLRLEVPRWPGLQPV